MKWHQANSYEKSSVLVHNRGHPRRTLQEPLGTEELSAKDKNRICDALQENETKLEGGTNSPPDECKPNAPKMNNLLESSGQRTTKGSLCLEGVCTFIRNTSLLRDRPSTVLEWNVKSRLTKKLFWA